MINNGQRRKFLVKEKTGKGQGRPFNTESIVDWVDVEKFTPACFKVGSGNREQIKIGQGRDEVALAQERHISMLSYSMHPQ